MSSPLFVYLQRPDNGQWVTVGRYSLDANIRQGRFCYSPRYLEAGFQWSIDPVNLPLIKTQEFLAHRYGGLHDVLRDAAPDSWGKAVIAHALGFDGLRSDKTELQYLLLSGNADRFGALAVGHHRKPSVAALNAPRMAQLTDLVLELKAIAAHAPAHHAGLRKRLFGTPSLGGARPKATVRDQDKYWLVKPALFGDVLDIPRLEYASAVWMHASGLRASPCEVDVVTSDVSSGISVLRVLRFDRSGQQRLMTVSAASLLETSYPSASGAEASRWSYPMLAQSLRRIGCPPTDLLELYQRMIFNAVVGNDDDHPRNHAVLWQQDERRWRLSPAYDVVPNPTETPAHLSMQLCLGSRQISRANLLQDARHFGLSPSVAQQHLDDFLLRMQTAFAEHAQRFDTTARSMMALRLRENTSRLSA
jgi:serine/threonine-protein kinase HipA